LCGRLSCPVSDLCSAAQRSERFSRRQNLTCPAAPLSASEFLVIDEFGFDRVERLESPEAAHLLYKVIVARHRRRSTALLTNIDFDGWADYMGDAPLAMALLDRLVEGAIIIKIKGKSYRATKAKTANASEKQSS